MAEEPSDVAGQGGDRVVATLGLVQRRQQAGELLVVGVQLQGGFARADHRRPITRPLGEQGEEISSEIITSVQNLNSVLADHGDRPYLDLATWTSLIGSAYLPVTVPPVERV